MDISEKLKEDEVREEDDLLVKRNLLRIAIFNNSDIRALFPEDYFSDKSVPALEMKIKLTRVGADSHRLIDCMGDGVHDALQKTKLKTLEFCVCEAFDGAMIEEYGFSFTYCNSESQEVSMNIINLNDDNKKGETVSTDITPDQMRSLACKMVRTLVQLMTTLDKMPKECIILMKLFYYDHVTPADYEPLFSQSCSIEEAQVNNKHFVKSDLDPCEDEFSLCGDDDSLSDSALVDDGTELSLTLIIAMIDNDRVVMAANSRTVQGDTKESVNEKSHKIFKVFDTVFMAGSGRVFVIYLIGRSIKDGFPQGRILLKDTDMDFIAKFVKRKMEAICMVHNMDLRKEAFGFVVIGAIENSAGWKLMDEYLKDNETGVFNSYEEMVTYSKNCIEYVANNSKTTGGDYINTVLLYKGEVQRKSPDSRDIIYINQPKAKGCTYVKDESVSQNVKYKLKLKRKSVQIVG